MTRDPNNSIPAPMEPFTNQSEDHHDQKQVGAAQSPTPSDALDATHFESVAEPPLNPPPPVSAPLVDQALEATRVRDNETTFAEDELAALKEELFSLKAKVEIFGLTIRDEALDRVEEFSTRTRRTIRSRPWQSIAAALAVGFMLGHRR